MEYNGIILFSLSKSGDFIYYSYSFGNLFLDLNVGKVRVGRQVDVCRVVLVLLVVVAAVVSAARQESPSLTQATPRGRFVNHVARVANAGFGAHVHVPLHPILVENIAEMTHRFYKHLKEGIKGQMTALWKIKLNCMKATEYEPS